MTSAAALAEFRFYEELNDFLPQKVREAYERFQLCRGCDRIYWEGTHYAGLRRLLDLAARADEHCSGC